MPAARAPAEVQDAIRRLAAQGLTQTEIHKRLGVNRQTVRRYANPGSDAAPADLPPGKHEAPPADPPPPHPQSYTPYPLDTPGWWLVLSDCHVPYHDSTTVRLAVEEARRRRAVGVLVNGDLLDSHELSHHDKDPSAPRYTEEVETCGRMLAWLRSRLPQARLVYKEGNHEERLTRYLVQRAPALFGLEGFDLPGILGLAGFGVEWVAGRRVAALGRLNVLHGHEYPGGASSPVNPARGLYLKARSVALCGHHHQTSEHHARDIRGRAEAAWSVGCACFLSPAYMPLNNWNHGFALVEVSADGGFAVDNKRVVNGQVV